MKKKNRDEHKYYFYLNMCEFHDSFDDWELLEKKLVESLNIDYIKALFWAIYKISPKAVKYLLETKNQIDIGNNISDFYDDLSERWIVDQVSALQAAISHATRYETFMLNGEVLSEIIFILISHNKNCVLTKNAKGYNVMEYLKGFQKFTEYNINVCKVFSEPLIKASNDIINIVSKEYFHQTNYPFFFAWKNKETPLSQLPTDVVLHIHGFFASLPDTGRKTPTDACVIKSSKLR